MPTYEYECQKCGYEFELFESISAEPRKRCPKCRGKVVRKLGMGSGVLFKGSGFYTTDYRSESYKKSAAAEKSSSSSSSADSGKKSGDSKAKKS